MTNELRADTRACHRGWRELISSSPYMASFSILGTHATSSWSCTTALSVGLSESGRCLDGSRRCARDLIDALAERTPTE